MGWNSGINRTREDESAADRAFENETISDAGEADPVPLVAGERRLAAKWISRVYNQYTEEDDTAQATKK